MKKRLLAVLMCVMLLGISIPCVAMAEEAEQESFEDEKDDDEKDEDSDESEKDEDEGDEESYDDDLEAPEVPGDEDSEIEVPEMDNPENEYIEPEIPEIEELEPVYEEPAEETQIEETVAEEEELIPDIDEDLVEEVYGDVGLLNPFALQDDVVAPNMADNSWQGYPLSYHYNWDNSQNCWQWGEYYNGNCYKTPVGTYDTNVRHAVGLYCDGQNIHLYVKYALIYMTRVNGDQFTFAVDGQSASFQFVFDDNGAPITGCNRMPGTYRLDLRNANGSKSGSSTGFVGTLEVHENNENDELELIIPLELLKQQNSAINLDTFSEITFFNPNLMYQTQTCAGAGNGKLPFAIGSMLIFAGSLVWRKKFLFF